MNFLKHIMQQLDDHSLGLLGAVLGENESKVRDGVKSAVPKILSAMVSATQDEQSRDMLWRELRDTDTTVANGFSRQMYYKDSKALVATGHDQLDGLIGTGTHRLIQSVSRESDTGSTSAKRLVGAVTPLVFASVANHQQSKQLSQAELGSVLEQQKNHLSDWEGQGQHLSGTCKNAERNEPLFSDLPKAGTAIATATAVASATLGTHHFHNRDEDQQSDDHNKDSGPYSGVQQSDPDQGFDQRSHDRRFRKPIAVNPAHSGFGSQAGTNDQPSNANTVADGNTVSDGNAQIDTESGLWTPDTAQKRSADGTLQYPNRDTAANTAKTAGASNQKSGGWFHWLWWPVLFFGSLLGLCLLLLDPADRSLQPDAQNTAPAVVATSEDESTSSDTELAAELTAVDEDSENQSENKNFDSDVLSSSIQIAPSESDDAPESHESNQDKTPSDKTPSLKGNIEIDATTKEDETATADGEAESDGEDNISVEEATEDNASLELVAPDLEIDADEKVETLLSAIETELVDVNDETRAKIAKKSLTGYISDLEKVLADRPQWEDEIEILVDFQLEEGQKMLAQAKKKVFQSAAVKKILKGKLKELNALMKTINDSQ